MKDVFTTIMDKHELDDSKLMQDSICFLQTVKSEYANGEELLKVAKENPQIAQDFLSKKINTFPVTPIRQSNQFHIQKHTASQIPYFHTHNFYELIYVHKGNCTQMFKNGNPLKLTSGSCALLTPNTEHLINKCSNSDIILKIVIPCDLFKRTGGEIMHDIPSDKVVCYDKISETATFAIMKLLENQTRTSPFTEQITQSYLTILFVELNTAQKTDIVIEQALNKYFADNLKSANLWEFATIQGYNVNYASRLIKEKTGQTFSQLLNFYRINKAKELLLCTDKCIEEIAFDIGYNNTSGFYKLFLSVCGMTPNQYRSTMK